MSEQNIEHQQRSKALTDAAKYFKEACEIFQREATRLREEQESIDAMSKKLDQVHFSSTIKLNVGGQHFTTSVQTLTKDPNSMLAAMFSGRFDMKPSEDGSFFIDRDGTHFRVILNFLRTGKLTLPEGATCTKELEEEAEFYQIHGLIDALRPAKLTVKACMPDEPFRESTILTNVEYRKILKGWLTEVLVGEWRLLFQASRDGFAASAFHSKCDNKGPTVTAVKSGANIFGGFTEKPWTSPHRGRYVNCRQAFLFSLVNPSALGPTKLSLITGKEGNGIYYYSNCGPVFGDGNDLYISNNANTNCSGGYLGNTYQLPPGQQSTFFTGAIYFTVTDYEVFGLQQ